MAGRSFDDEGHGPVVALPLRPATRPRGPVRVAPDVQLPFEHDDAPSREAAPPFGPVAVPCDVHAPSAHDAEPLRDVVRPAALVVVPLDVQLAPAHEVVPLWVAPRAPVAERVSVAADASTAAKAIAKAIVKAIAVAVAVVKGAGLIGRCFMRISVGSWRQAAEMQCASVVSRDDRRRPSMRIEWSAAGNDA